MSLPEQVAAIHDGIVPDGDHLVTLIEVAVATPNTGVVNVIPAKVRAPDERFNATEVVPIKVLLVIAESVSATVPVAAGRVIVVVPATALACTVVVPLVAPFKATLVAPVNAPEMAAEPLKL